VQQPGQEFAQPDEDQGHHPRGGEHLADHDGLGVAVDAGRDLQKRHQRELRPDADQQQQERVDHQVDVDRRVIHPADHPAAVGGRPRPFRVKPDRRP
jgi:hypothetical protein